LLFYKRYLDNILAFLVAYPDPVHNAKLWQEFKDLINDFHGLKWTFTGLTKTVVVSFTDMPIAIDGDKIVSIVYEKVGTLSSLSLYTTSFGASTRSTLQPHYREIH